MNYSMICAEGDLSILKEITEKILTKRKISIVREPAPKIIMVRHVDPLDKNEFFLGEVLSTYCEVEVDGHIGCGCVIGSADERSMYAAVIDAVIGNKLPESGDIHAMFEAVESKIVEERNKNFNRVLKTKVNFETRRDSAS